MAGKRGLDDDDEQGQPPAKAARREFRTVVYPSEAGLEMFGFYQSQRDFQRASGADTDGSIEVTLPFFPSDPACLYSLLERMSTSSSVGEAMTHRGIASTEAVYNVVRAYDYLAASDELVEATKQLCKEMMEGTAPSARKSEYVAVCVVAGVDMVTRNLENWGVPRFVHSLEVAEEVIRVIGGDVYVTLHEWMRRALSGVLPPINKVYQRLRRAAPLAFHLGDSSVRPVVAGGALLQCFVEDGDSEAWTGSDVDYWLPIGNKACSPSALIKHLNLKQSLSVEWCARTGPSTVQLKLSGDPRTHNVICVTDAYNAVSNFDLDCVRALADNAEINVTTKFLRCLAQRTCMAGDNLREMKILKTAARAAKYAARGFAAPSSWPKLVEPHKLPQSGSLQRMRLTTLGLQKDAFVPLCLSTLQAFGYHEVCDESPPIVDRNFFYERKLALVVKVPGERSKIKGPEFFFHRLRVASIGHENESRRVLVAQLDDATQAYLLRAAKAIGAETAFFERSIRDSKVGLIDAGREPRMAPGVYDVYATPPPLPVDSTRETPCIASLQVRWRRRYGDAD